MTQAPQTADELFALPEFDRWSILPAPGRAITVKPDDIAFAVDSDGVRWSPYCHTDDKWYKVRR